eukprot:13884641-Alexandrium_andersonii.AAC.1
MSIAEYGAAISDEWAIRFVDWREVAYLRMPSQHVKPWILEWPGRPDSGRPVTERPSGVDWA